MTLTLLPLRSSKEAMYSGTVVLAIRVRRRFHEAISVVPCKQAQHCCATLRRSQNNKSAGTCYAKSFTGFKSYATSANDVVVPCKWTQHVEPNVACCWPTMLRPFAWAFRTYTTMVMKGIGMMLHGAVRFSNGEDEEGCGWIQTSTIRNNVQRCSFILLFWIW